MAYQQRSGVFQALDPFTRAEIDAAALAEEARAARWRPAPIPYRARPWDTVLLWLFAIALLCAFGAGWRLGAIFGVGS